MKTELTRFLWREKYERKSAVSNYRNGGYESSFTLKGVGELKTHVPLDRKGNFETKVLPKSKRYEQALSEDLSILFLSGVSTRNLELISQKLLGRKISNTEVRKSNQDLPNAVEAW